MNIHSTGDGVLQRSQNVVVLLQIVPIRNRIIVVLPVLFLSCSSFLTSPVCNFLHPASGVDTVTVGGVTFRDTFRAFTFWNILE